MIQHKTEVVTRDMLDYINSVLRANIDGTMCSFVRYYNADNTGLAPIVFVYNEHRRFYQFAYVIDYNVWFTYSAKMLIYIINPRLATDSLRRLKVLE